MPSTRTFPLVSDADIRASAQTFKLFGDESRLRILVLLAQNERLNVTEMTNRTGQSQPAISQNLSLLRVSGLIESRREGKCNYYSLCGDAADILLAAFRPVETK